MSVRFLVVLFCMALLASCASSSYRGYRGDTHIVRKGETLYSIAWRYDRSPADLARWNRLGDGSLIHPGQVIRLTPPAAGSGGSAKALPGIPSEPPPAWSWPTAGRINVEFGGNPGPGTGVLIDGKAGQAVFAAASGHVVYAGGGLIGYGQLIILKHNDTYLSAYGYNASLLVREGQSISKGQKIATMGEGPERKPRLHFEIRQNGKPVNPRRFLPSR